MVHCSVRNKVSQQREDIVDGKEPHQSEEEEMDSSLWSRLPEDILLSVLARLPLESLARLQGVCRDWLVLCQNRAFWHSRSETTSCNSWFIFQRKHQPLPSTMSVDCFNSHTNKWHKFKFDHLPQIQRVCATSGSLLLCVGKIRVSRLVPANRNIPGLIEPPSYKFLDMIVYNPLKPNFWERIAERLGSFVPHVGIIADAHSGNYKVILASLEKTEVYDSCTKSWKLFDTILSPQYDICSSPIEYKGRLLFLGVQANGQGKVFAYNLDENRCSSFDNLFSRDPFPRFGYLENCGGRLLMVRLTVSPTELLRSRGLEYSHTSRFERNFQLRVCEYLHAGDDLDDGVWRELSSVPMLELEKSMSVNSKGGARFLAGASLAQQNDLLCLTMGMKDGKLDCTNCVEGRAVFLYSLSQNLWCFVGERPEWAHDGVICMKSLQFQPSFRVPIVP